MASDTLRELLARALRTVHRHLGRVPESEDDWQRFADAILATPEGKTLARSRIANQQERKRLRRDSERMAEALSMAHGFIKSLDLTAEMMSMESVVRFAIREHEKLGEKP